MCLIFLKNFLELEIWNETDEKPEFYENPSQIEPLHPKFLHKSTTKSFQKKVRHIILDKIYTLVM